MKNYNDLKDKQFGKWKVVKHLGTDKNRDRIWLCKCSCGTLKEVKAMYLLAGTSTKCVSCAKAKRPYKDLIPDVLWKRINNNANKRSITLEISKEFAEDLFLKQNGKCALTGLDLEFPKHGTGFLKGEYSASLDRINSTEGYTVNNVQWVHRNINMMKHVFTQEYFIELCKKVVDYNYEKRKENQAAKKAAKFGKST